MTNVANIGGAIYAAQTTPLKEFAWGPTVVDIVNGFLNEDIIVTLEMTGKELAEVIHQMDKGHRILSIKLPDDDDDDDGAPQQREQPIPIWFSFSILIIVLLVLAYYIMSSAAAGGAPDGAVIESFLELLKVLLGGNPSDGSH